MEKLTAIPNLGKWFEIATILNENLQKIEQELVSLGYLTHKNVGYFQNEQELNNAYPNPNQGDWAIVDGYIYKASLDDSGYFWENTDTQLSINANLTDYLKKNDDLSETYFNGVLLSTILGGKLTSDKVLHFDGVIDSVSNVATGVAPWNGHIYYSIAQDAFVMRQISDTYDNSYQSYTFLQNNVSSIDTYNNLVDGVFLSNKTNIYIDNDNSIYAFISGVFTKIVVGAKKFTQSSIVNKAIKELYINTSDISQYYVHALFRKWYDNSNNAYKCQLTIQDANGTVCEYYDAISEEGHEPPALIQLAERNSSGVNGYAVIDWSAVDSGSYWYIRTLDNKAFLTNYATMLDFNPTISSYLQSENKQDILTLNVKDNGNIVIGNLQGQSKEFMPATPSGDPLHYAYINSGALWDDESQSWMVNGISGLTNKQVGKYYNDSDMSELLFRRLWNTLGNVILNENCKPKFDNNTGYYRANGVWHIDYNEAMKIYSINNAFGLGISTLSGGKNISGITTLPFFAKRYTRIYDIMWQENLVDIRTSFRDCVSSVEVSGYSTVLDGGAYASIGYSPNLRIIRDSFMSENNNLSFIILDRMSSLLHFMQYSTASSINVKYQTVERLSYMSLYYLLSKSNAQGSVTLHPTVYGFVTGTLNPEELSQEPILPQYAKYNLIPYQQNLKVATDNTFWREELDVKGVNGEYIYPSFAEYLTNNPSNFATAEEWQALATLAQEKNITLVQG